MRSRKIPTPCAWPDCDTTSVARNLCARHYVDMRKRAQADGSWSPYRSTQPEIKPFEYENPAGEAELIRLAEQQESQPAQSFVVPAA
jgi:hypothetical protein